VDVVELLGDNYYDGNRFIVNIMTKYNLTNSLSIKFVGKNITGNNVPPASFGKNTPWFGSMGDNEKKYYMGFDWKK